MKKVEDKYTNNSCWICQDSTITLVTIDKAREDCEYCNSRICRRRLSCTYGKAVQKSFIEKEHQIKLDREQIKLDKQRSKIDEWQERIKKARILAKKYQAPITTTKQKSRKDD